MEGDRDAGGADCRIGRADASAQEWRTAMKVEVLASVMNQSLDKIAEEMALDSEAVIINQCGQL